MHADVAEKMWTSWKNDQEIHLVLAINVSSFVLRIPETFQISKLTPSFS